MLEDYYYYVFAAGFISLIIGLVEIIGVHRFWEFSYKTGFPVYRKTLNIAGSVKKYVLNETISKEHGKYRFAANDKILFTSRITAFNFFELDSPMKFKSTALLRPGGAVEVVSRIGIGGSLLMACLTLFLGGITYKFVSQDNFSWDIVSLGLFLVFWLLLIGIWFAGYRIEKRRMAVKIEELEDILQGNYE